MPNNFEAFNNITITQPATTTYRVDLENKRIIGKVDGIAAYNQAILKILKTPRLSYEIYNQFYGTDLDSLVGVSRDIAATLLHTVIKECIMQDTRTIDVPQSTFTVRKGANVDTLLVEFEVISSEGNANVSWEVPYGV